ncbi:hypothetical protein BXZ70DRAFT_1043109 [Cristinia sonorae]|uniref:Uncharacterized protein n=1 Tax=Cristinia sonorae TaxID=1940300 RepID=A0A8K0UWK6_9AGAR|nr:hypothetical protein BXZ70DRAFT_1043109 [Cristinia sonorae]
MASRPLSSATSKSKRYSHSVHLIPTPGEIERRPERFEPFVLKPWVAFGVATLMVVFGVAISVVYNISKRNQGQDGNIDHDLTPPDLTLRLGFPVPQKNVFQGVASTSFLTSFFPTLLIIPMVFAWHVTDQRLRSFHPYVILAQGNARAENSLLLNYTTMNQLSAFWSSMRKGHWLILVSMLTAVITNLLQPFAGALLSVKPIPSSQITTVPSATALGLSPDVKTLNAFLSAAGFTEAAAFQGLPDPPFVRNNWASAQIKLPENPGLNASMILNTFGIRTNTNCVNPTTLTLAIGSSTSYSITATTSTGCSANVTFNPASADQQYGSVAVSTPAACGVAADTTEEFLPVMFWFFHLKDGTNTPQAKACICSPTINVFNVEAKVNLNNGSLADVKILSAYTTPNNVTGGTQAGRAFNGVALQSLATDQFVSARATAIAAGLPGAILRLASQSGLQQFFDSEDAFLNLTTQIYTQHLSVSAKSIYFVQTTDPILAIKTSLVERILVDELAAIALSILLILTGLVGLTIHTLHLRLRRRTKLHLTSEPGSIASALALTSRSGFGELLVPYDDEDSIARKLRGLRFMLDGRTGAIVALESEEGSEEEDVAGGYMMGEYAGGGSGSESPPAKDEKSSEEGLLAVPPVMPYDPYSSSGSR